jgi:anti-sigma factor RsiW
MTTQPLTCQELVELVTEYLEGTLPPVARARFDAHLAACDYCGAYLAQMQQTIRALGRLTEQSIAPEAQQRLLEVFRTWRQG